jgi:putative aldouronate transport system permease protein
MDTALKGKKTNSQKQLLWAKMKHQKFLLWITVPFIIYIFVFSYLPLAAWAWSFFDYRPGVPLTMDQFVGLQNYINLFKDEGFWLALRNTLAISVLDLSFGTISAVAFAVFLNEMKNSPFKRLTQTVSYLPHFISWVVVSGIFINLLKSQGLVNDLLMNIGLIQTPIEFWLEGKYYWVLITLISMWKEMGWAAIIYLAAMSGINTELYDAAYVDGAGRMKRIWHVTLPGIAATIIVLLILRIGWVLFQGFEQSLLLGNAGNFEYADVIGTYIYRYGLKSREYSYAMAAGVFQSLVGVVLVVSANLLSKKMNNTSVF